MSGVESLNSLHVKKFFGAFSVHQQNCSVKETNSFENKVLCPLQSDSHWHFSFMRVYLSM